MVESSPKLMSIGFFLLPCSFFISYYFFTCSLSRRALIDVITTVEEEE